MDEQVVEVKLQRVGGTPVLAQYVGFLRNDEYSQFGLSILVNAPGEEIIGPYMITIRLLPIKEG
jgi:hypothetical protein